MLSRRTLIQSLAALLPASLVGRKERLIPIYDQAGRSDVLRVQEPSPTIYVVRNSGRTYRQLTRAIQLLGEYPSVVFIVYCHAEVKRLSKDIDRIVLDDMGINHYDYYPSHPGRYDIKGGMLRVVSCESRAIRGCRAHFVLDHSVAERLDSGEYSDLIQNLRHAEVAAKPTFPEEPT